MNEVRFVGGPFDGQTGAFRMRLRVNVGFRHGWKFSCGHPASTWGFYYEYGEGIAEWEEPERDVIEDHRCNDCWQMAREKGNGNE